MGEIKLAVPPVGLYTPVFEEIFKSLGNVEIIRAELSEKTIHRGVKNSPVMMCYPYKVTLGYIMDALDKGANKIVTYTTRGQCRFRHFWKVQEHTLRDIGYDDFEFVVLNPKTLFKELKDINPKASWFTVMRAALNGWKKIREIEKNNEDFNRHKISKDDINILVVGELYTILVNDMNLSVVDKLKKFGAKPKYSFSISQFAKDLLSFLGKDKYTSEALTYLEGPTGGMGLHTLAGVIYGCEKRYDGIVHVLPMSCSPEIIVEPAITSICQKKGMPLLTVECDENNSELNLETRLETFVELIRRKKQNRRKEQHGR